MADRRRVNGPASGTTAPVYNVDLVSKDAISVRRARGSKELRKIFLQTGLTPSASGSAYLELEQQSVTQRHKSSISHPSALKLTCTVHGPRPLPRSAPFTPNMLLSTNVKFAPFASRQRRGYLRDAAERDLAVHLDTALRGVIIAERWPKSGMDVVITILEGEEDTGWAGAGAEQVPTGLMVVLAGCITAASAAIIDAGIDCVGIVSGGVAAVVSSTSETNQSNSTMDISSDLVLDPCPSEHSNIAAACVVAYLKARDEVTEVWIKARLPLLSHPGAISQPEVEHLVDGAVQAASAVQAVIIQALSGPP